jgi:septum formation topological specificity factor MinE
MFLFFLGWWEEDVLQVILKYLVIGNTEVRLDLIRTMVDGKNVQYVNKVKIG